MITFSRIITIIFVLSFSSNMLPMDPPQVHSQKTQNILSQVDPLKIQGISWGDLNEKRKQLGFCFAVLPEEILTSFLVQSPPSTKNGLRKTNKTFSRLLSWENIQSFMLCKELCASERDIKSLIIPIIYQYRNNQENIIPIFTLKFLQDISSKLRENSKDQIFSYEISGLSEHIRLSFANNIPSITLWNLVGPNHYRLQDNIHPLVIACIAHNTQAVEKCLQEISLQSLDPKYFERVIHILIKNNDVKSLKLILAGKKIKNLLKKGPITSKQIQLTIMCASDKVLELLLHLYNKARAGETATCLKIPEEKDFIVEWLGLVNVTEGTHLHSIIELRHPQLAAIHSDNPENYHKCLKMLFKVRDLKKFNPPVVRIDKEKSSKKSKKGFLRM